MKKEKPTNKLANNSPKRKKKDANPISGGKIRELELSITNKCNLNCLGCGFNIPKQVTPVNGQRIDEHIKSLELLKSCGVKVEKIIISGGEASLSRNLNKYLVDILKVGISEQIEIVTNGLYPKGINRETLANLDSLIISDYVMTEEFEGTWRQYIKALNYKGKIEFRRKTAWDDLLSEVKNKPEQTRHHWSTCFYRKYDVTLERGRLFSCSRIAKKKWDEQGLLINSETSLSDVYSYLTSKVPRDACYSCATIGNNSNIPVAVQTRNNIERIILKAEQYMRECL
ncbi:hypothetical protein AB733_04915 [Photobacterium swingsii]|uniref:Radical SAM protein n=1 Tax=Photobacterium swingsii TaxID=680026 RepID=A0A0J8VDT5_9GAMM|nr:radical SAM protein [Photobacterium swingsii]KMV31466.1 hypothetical protein AB733_04915 [Photobacterium swingsii]PSW25018.1 radical SAM protein [Photobacterium swingsii]